MNIFQDHYRLCATLQTKLKDQFLLLTTEQDQKSTLQKKLNTSLKNYYRNLIQLDLNLNRDTTTHKILLQDQGFGHCYTFIKQIILALSKSPDLCLAIIKKHNQQGKVETMSGVVRIIVNSMYQNIVDDQITNKDILYFMKGVLKMIVESKKEHQRYNFQDKTLLNQIVKQFMNKTDYFSYTSSVVKSTLLQLAKLDRVIDFSYVDEQDIKMLHKISSKKYDSPTKNPVKNANPFSSFSDKIIYSKCQAYSTALRKKDAKIRTTAAVRTKNKYCVSGDLQRLLGISDNISFPSFTCSNSTSSDLKQQDKINFQFELILQKKDSSSNKYVFGPDIILLKNLVFIFFTDLFKMLYSMPSTMRTLCRLLFNELLKKFNRKNSMIVLGNFIVGHWILSALGIKQHILESTKISDFTNHNAELVKKIVVNIINNSFDGIDQAFKSQFATILSGLRISLFNYLSELINIQAPLFEEKKETTQIKSYCVCLSVADVAKFIEMVKNSSAEIASINDKLVKKIERIQQMADEGIFGPKKDKSTNKQYKNFQSYVLFIDLVLPKQLSFDYLKYYTDAFKNSKVKNIFRQVLLNISDIQTFTQFPLYCNSLNDFFDYILKTRQQKNNLNSLDHIPAQLKISYLISITKKIKMQELLDGMLKQQQERLQFLQKAWDKSKECYLRAISCILRQSQIISYNQINYKQEIKKKKLEEFMKTAKINMCLTSPKTRQKQTILKTNMMNQLSGDKQKIWFEPQLKCIHSALNLQFIKSLTGEGEKVKTKYQSHIINPIKFPDIFCGLPQVKQKGMMGNDVIGMKQIISSFLNLCIITIKKDQQYAILSEDEKWLQQNLQQKISKKIYDKLYPKMATYDDLALYFRLKTLDWVSYEHLKIDPFMRVDGMWDIAAKQLKQLDKMKTASQKLTCIVDGIKMLIQSFSLVGVEGKPISVEDIFPIVVNVLIKAAPRRLVSNINFIDMFANPNRLMSQDGSYFAQLTSAVMYCQNLKHDQINMGVIEFNRIIYQKQIEYGIYFLLNRKKQSSNQNTRRVQLLKKICREKNKNSQTKKYQNQSKIDFGHQGSIEK